MKSSRLTDAARMAEKASLPINIFVRGDHFEVQGVTCGHVSYRQCVAFDEVEFAGHNALAAAVHQVEKQLAS